MLDYYVMLINIIDPCPYTVKLCKQHCELTKELIFYCHISNLYSLLCFSYEVIYKFCRRSNLNPFADIGLRMITLIAYFAGFFNAIIYLVFTLSAKGRHPKLMPTSPKLKV